MCGIAGFVGPGDRRDIAAMTERLVHRGPDGEGFYHDPANRVFLGHRRLAVIDPAGGQQPMWNETSDVAVVANGEIYNHLELRRELMARGHRFKTDHSDTEVLVHGYEEWGEDLPSRLDGMFAFAVYDRARQRLFMARDRFGEKPLYYAHAGGLFLFASELSALAGHRGFRAELDPLSLRKYFAYGFLPAPHAGLRDARKLPAGHRLRLRLNGGAPHVDAYWNFELEPAPSVTPERETELAAELRALLRQAVARRLMSDVPLGIFLSGGVDSSAILALAAELRPAASIDTFTIGFNESSFDESAPALRMAQFVGSRHHHETLDLNDAARLAPEVLGRLDEPLGDASLVPTFLLSRFARQGVTVALGGDGGDELFAGYDPIAAIRYAEIYQKAVPRSWRRPLARLADRLPITRGYMGLDFRLRRALAGAALQPAMWNPAWLGPARPEEIAELFRKPVLAEDLYSEAIALWHRDERLTPLERTLEFYTRLYLPDNILTKLDRASMMHGLEARAPFLDPDVVNFARRLPTDLKYRKGQRKYILKRALQGLVPDELLQRRKQGFGVPLLTWLGRLAPANRDIGIKVNHAWVGRQWHAHRTGAADKRLFLWSWLALQHSWTATLATQGAAGVRARPAAAAVEP
jgi:asparagine synthase (glutamine-hydrolysing)